MSVSKDLYINQGSDWEFHILLRDDDKNILPLTSYTARMMVRSTVDSGVVLETLTTANGKIVITAATGDIKLTLTNAATAVYTFTEAVYDLEIIDATSIVTRLMEGNFYVSKEVTRS